MRAGQLIAMDAHLFRHIRIVCLAHFQKCRFQTQRITYENECTMLDWLFTGHVPENRLLTHQMIIVWQYENQFLADITNTGQIACPFGGDLVVTLRTRRILLHQHDDDFCFATLETRTKKHKRDHLVILDCMHQPEVTPSTIEPTKRTGIACPSIEDRSIRCPGKG